LFSHQILSSITKLHRRRRPALEQDNFLSGVKTVQILQFTRHDLKKKILSAPTITKLKIWRDKFCRDFWTGQTNFVSPVLPDPNCPWIVSMYILLSKFKSPDVSLGKSLFQGAFFGRIQKRTCDLRSFGFFTTTKTRRSEKIKLSWKRDKKDGSSYKSTTTKPSFSTAGTLFAHFFPPWRLHRNGLRSRIPPPPVAKMAPKDSPISTVSAMCSTFFVRKTAYQKQCYRILPRKCGFRFDPTWSVDPFDSWPLLGVSQKKGKFILDSWIHFWTLLKTRIPRNFLLCS